MKLDASDSLNFSLVLILVSDYRIFTFKDLREERVTEPTKSTQYHEAAVLS